MKQFLLMICAAIALSGCQQEENKAVTTGQTAAPANPNQPPCQIGPQGPQGIPGKDGKDGVGTPGKDGKDGLNGKDGVGTPGKDGKNGLDGKNGTNGTNGAKGDKGDKGDKGPSGNDGSSAAFSIAKASASVCPNGGSTLYAWVDVNSNGTYESGVDRNLQTVNICNPKCECTTTPPCKHDCDFDGWCKRRKDKDHDDHDCPFKH